MSTFAVLHTAVTSARAPRDHHGERADAPGCAVHHRADRTARRRSRATLESGEPGQRDGGRLLERRRRRFTTRLRSAATGVLRPGAPPDHAHHLVADGEPRDAGSHRHDDTGHVRAGTGFFGRAARPSSGEPLSPRGHVPVVHVHRGGTDVDEDLALRRSGDGDALHLQHLGCAVRSWVTAFTRWALLVTWSFPPDVQVRLVTIHRKANSRTASGWSAPAAAVTLDGDWHPPARPAPR